MPVKGAASLRRGAPQGVANADLGAAVVRVANEFDGLRIDEHVGQGAEIAAQRRALDRIAGPDD